MLCFDCFIRAWVPESSIAVCDEESFKEKVTEKKFCAEEDFRMAVIEAMRICKANGVKIPSSLMELSFKYVEVKGKINFVPYHDY